MITQRKLSMHTNTHELSLRVYITQTVMLYSREFYGVCSQSCISPYTEISWVRCLKAQNNTAVYAGLNRVHCPVYICCSNLLLRVHHHTSVYTERYLEYTVKKPDKILQCTLIYKEYTAQSTEWPKKVLLFDEA